MASPDLSHWFPVRSSETFVEFGSHAGGASIAARSRSRAVTLLWTAVDILTVIIAAGLATHFRKVEKLSYFDHRSLAGNPTSFLIYLSGFALILILVGRAHGLYGPLQSFSGLREQRLTVQTCFTASLILAGALYFGRADTISRAVVVATLLMTAFLLCFRRAIWRFILYKRYERGVDTRNVLILGVGSSGLAIRSHLQRIRHLGFTFKGFVRTDERSDVETEALGADGFALLTPDDVLGGLQELGDLVRRHFIDEIFVTGPCERGVVKHLIAEARSWGIDVRVVPDLYDGLAWTEPIEYVGQFPTMPLHRHHIPVFGLMLKRGLDLFISAIALILMLPFMILIAMSIWIDSRGPIFYCAERIGRKGRTFRCWKFRTMVANADSLREQFNHRNERDGVLFKMTEDPRVTRVGRILRKYSLDELPQFYNVLAGHMSVVGPRPPLAGEVRQYELPHLRRLEVLPGITGLWQVQARQDPSFDQYISLDTAYIDNWSLWLDIKIMTRTLGVLVSGTGA